MITSPDGKKYRVTGDTAEGAYQALQQHIGAPAAAQEPGVSSDQPKSYGDTGNQKVDAGTVYTDEMLFGLPGKAAAGLNALAQRGIAALPGQSPWEDQSVSDLYDKNRGQYQNARQQYAEEHPVANTAATIGGAIHGGGSMAKLGSKAISTVAPRVAQAMQASYAGRMAGDAATGVAQGAATAYGHDQDVGTGALIGGIAGGTARPVLDAGGAALRSIGGLIGVGNSSRAKQAIVEAMMRSGRSADDITSDLSAAAADGQPGYMVADALGNSGQRMLTGVARAPGDMRQTIAETLTARQSGQGERLANALAEGFDAPQTAAQAQAAMRAARTAAADTNYGAARSSAGAVDPTGAIQAADEFLTPGAQQVMSPLNNIADDSVEAAVRKARGYLTDGNSTLSDFNSAFRAKQELDAMIEGAKPTVQRQLIPIRNQLDDALAKASDPYAAARDTFRGQSKAIDAVDQGAAAASGRTRAADNVGQFGRMTPDQQQGFRTGYADPYIARVEAASSSPTTNKARMLQTEKTRQEFPAFAAPGRADQLGNRIAREQRMFETANAALGGSKTADNLADMADVQSFDPTMIGNLLTGNFKGAALQGLAKGVNTLQGRNQQTRDMIARMLLETDPTKATAALADAVQSGEKLTKTQETLIRAIISGGGTAPARFIQGQ
ncbi:hypothetical protein ACQZ4Z_13050 [Agrobacterium vitis]|uniref:hypothetical protein n=1 Tax=Agrobacterium vitis TaxID=373 RepID=UPI0015718771|nr:hypothetical protein [Agrobacterium vitis]NSZ42842.1 hypothetical protein [Agrobacterium vitis]